MPLFETRILAFWVVLFLFFCTNGRSQTPPEKPADWDSWRFSEKIIWRGTHLDPRIPYGPLIDKLGVKKLIELDRGPIRAAKVLFATDDPSKIRLKNLPKTFIMKPNNASGRAVLVVDGMLVATKKREKDFTAQKCTNEFLRTVAHEWLVQPYLPDKEVQYSLIKPMVFFEEYLTEVSMEIQLYLFNQKVCVIGILLNDAYTSSPVMSYYDENWNLFDVFHTQLETNFYPLNRPPYFDDLIAFAQRFTEGIDHVRVDFFINGDDLYFGEFTFTTGGGKWIEHLDVMVGNHWDFPDPKASLADSYVENLLSKAKKAKRP